MVKTGFLRKLKIKTLSRLLKVSGFLLSITLKGTISEMSFELLLGTVTVNTFKEAGQVNSIDM